VTILLVTHERDIAAFCGRTVLFRDGLVRSDTPNLAPASADQILATLPREPELEAAA
jgi:putative ABC transport system ATP-binding protein